MNNKLEIFELAGVIHSEIPQKDRELFLSRTKTLEELVYQNPTQIIIDLTKVKSMSSWGEERLEDLIASTVINKTKIAAILPKHNTGVGIAWKYLFLEEGLFKVCASMEEAKSWLKEV